MIVKATVILCLLAVKGTLAVPSPDQSGSIIAAQRNKDEKKKVNGFPETEPEKYWEVYCSQIPEGQQGNKSLTTEDCNGQSLTCIDCEQLLFCQDLGGKFQPYSCMKCPTFCDPESSTCVNEQPTQCVKHGPCTKEGFFPDPLDCRFYFQCTLAGDELKFTAKECEEGMVYDTDTFEGTGSCVKRVDPTDCCTVDCENKLYFMPYECDLRFYVMCRPNDSPIVFRCDDGTAFDPEMKHCKSKIESSSISSTTS